MTTTIPQRKYFDTEKKVFLERQMYVDNFGGVYGFRGEFHSGCLEKFHYVIEIPFTGILDIYIGDIIKIDYGLSSSLDPYQPPEPDVQIYEVIFKNGAYKGKNIDPLYPNIEDDEDNLYDLLADAERFEIIGSVLTNPELLESA